jgi:hypothetical protein
MDIDILFGLALLVFYFLTQILGRKKRPQAPPRETDYSEPSRGQEGTYGPEVDDALREIREALGWPSEVDPEPAPRSTTSAPAPQDRRTPLERARDEEAAQKRSPRTVKHDTSTQDRWVAAQKRAADRKKQLTAQFGEGQGIPELKPQKRGPKVHPIAKKLRTPEGARDAVIYTEIFTPRWKQNKEHGH